MLRAATDWRRETVPPLVVLQRGFERGFEVLRTSYREYVEWALRRPAATATFFIVLMAGSLLLFPLLGRDFFPEVDAGQMRLHVRAPVGTRIEQTQEYFAKVEASIREFVGAGQIDSMLDNIGLPYSGMNIALSDSATVGPMDGEFPFHLNSGTPRPPRLRPSCAVSCPNAFPTLVSSFSRPTSSIRS